MQREQSRTKQDKKTATGFEHEVSLIFAPCPCFFDWFITLNPLNKWKFLPFSEEEGEGEEGEGEGEGKGEGVGEGEREGEGRNCEVHYDSTDV